MRGHRALVRRRASCARTGKKLGLGSSAAIVVASLAALELERARARAGRRSAERAACIERALHRRYARPAPGKGGSGVDVAASACGARARGTSRRTDRRQPLRTLRCASAERAPVRGLGLLGCGASTAEFLARIRAFAARDLEACIARASPQQASAGRRGGSDSAAATVSDAAPADFWVAAIGRQVTSRSGELGEAAGAAIATPEHRGARATLAPAQRCRFLLPAGAGGGGMSPITLARAAAPAAFGARARARPPTRLDATARRARRAPAMIKVIPIGLANVTWRREGSRGSLGFTS